MYRNTLKIVGISIGAVLLTTLAIDASDALSGKGGSLLAQLVGVEQSVCPEGMVHVVAALTFSCVDEFEAVPSLSCPVSRPGSHLDTDTNLSKVTCTAASTEDAEPWRYVTREQAVILCTRAGKRLPSAAEWYQASLGTVASSCNVAGGAVAMGESFDQCRSATGIKNAVGNVWEWVSDDVIDGMYQGRNLPLTGYIAQVDVGGVATVTSEEVNNEMLGGYFWSKTDGAFGMIRGGFYGSRADASSYTVHAYTAPTFRGAAVGFRCVK
jgi:formylglycine-generating enzyme required for sulfatase activity